MILDRINFKVTGLEYYEIKKEAKEHGLTVEDYIRKASLNLLPKKQKKKNDVKKKTLNSKAL